MQTQTLKELEEVRTQAYKTYLENIEQTRKPSDEAIEKAYYAYLDADVQLRARKRVAKLPRQRIWMDGRGRIVVPEYMRDDLGLEIPCWVDIERYPAEGECKTIFIKKA